MEKAPNSVLNVKVVVAAFNQEKALVGAFPMIVKTDCGTNGSFYSTKGVITNYFIPILGWWTGQNRDTKTEIK